MTKVQLLIVRGVGGARMDFVGGWLGTLPNFIDNQWAIDPVTGQSYGLMQIAKALDSGESINSIATRSKFELDPTSNLTWVSTCHGFNLAQLNNLINSGAVRILHIDALTADQNKLNWEFICKTYLSKYRKNRYIEDKSDWLVDRSIAKEIITDQDRIDTVLSFITNIKTTPPMRLDPAGISCEYNKLFLPGGSYYLCEKLGLVAHPRYHEFWNAMLALSESPDTVHVWGHTWSKEMLLS